MARRFSLRAVRCWSFAAVRAGLGGGTPANSERLVATTNARLRHARSVYAGIVVVEADPPR